jgi:hypothetical protein
MASAKPLAIAGKIIAMAEDLRERGLLAEAAFFALTAAQYLQAARALQELHDAGIPPAERGDG